MKTVAKVREVLTQQDYLSVEVILFTGNFFKSSFQNYWKQLENKAPFKPHRNTFFLYYLNELISNHYFLHNNKIT